MSKIIRELPGVGLIILAAGNSSRLGMPKQLVNFQGQTLLQKITGEAVSSVCRPIVMVLGANDREFSKFLKSFDSEIEIVKNEEWRQGMGTSISCGVKAITEIDEKLNGIVLCVCDQPFVNAALINNLADIFLHQPSKIVASAYDQTLGVPALFDKSLFKDLMALQGKSGAKNIIEDFIDETLAIDFPAGEFDIDTSEDLQKLHEIE